jgi:hypothetical protein
VTCCHFAFSDLLFTDEATIPESPIEERLDEAQEAVVEPLKVEAQQKPSSPLVIRFHYQPPTPSKEVKTETRPDSRAVRTASVSSCSSLITQELMALDMVLDEDYAATKGVHLCHLVLESLPLGSRQISCFPSPPSSSSTQSSTQSQPAQQDSL